MKGKHQLTLTDAQGNIWLNVGVQEVELGDGCIQANFVEVTEPAKLAASATLHRRRRVLKKRKVLSKKLVLSVLEDIRKRIPAGAPAGLGKIGPIARKWDIGYSTAHSIHTGKHTHLRKKKK